MCFRGSDVVEHYRRNRREKEGSIVDRNVDDDGDEAIALNLDAKESWMRICAGPLQPLIFCLESVRMEFLQVATKYRLLDRGLLSSMQRMYYPKDRADDDHDDNDNDCDEETFVGEDESNADSLEGLDARERALPRSYKKPKTMTMTMTTDVGVEREDGGVGGLGQGTNPLDSFFPFDPYILPHSKKYIEPFYVHWDDVRNNGVGSNGNVYNQHADLASSHIDNKVDKLRNDSVDSKEMAFEMCRPNSPNMVVMDHDASIRDVVDDVSRQELDARWAEARKRARALSVGECSW